jgi:hypothetical protein
MEGRMKQISVALTEADRAELEFIQAKTGWTVGESIRTAIRVYAGSVRLWSK